MYIDTVYSYNEEHYCKQRSASYCHLRVDYVGLLTMTPSQGSTYTHTAYVPFTSKGLKHKLNVKYMLKGFPQQGPSGLRGAAAVNCIILTISDFLFTHNFVK